MKMFRTMKSSLQSEKGAALLTVFVVIMVLLTLGMGLLTLTTGNGFQAKADDVFEKAYYVAEAGAQQGIDYTRTAVLNAYNQIESDMNSGISSSNNATSFFNYITNYMASSSATKFTAALPDTASSGISTFNANIAASGSGDTRIYTVTSSATGSSLTRTVLGTITVKFVAVEKTGVDFGDECLLTGGAITVQNCSMAVYGNTRATGYDIKTSSTYTQTGSQIIDPSASANLDWKLDYAKRYKNKTVATPSYTAANGETVTGAMFGWANPLPYPMYLEGNSNASYTVQLAIDSPTKEVQIASAKNLTLSSGSTKGSSSNYIKLYSVGDMTITSSLDYAEIYCGGNLEIRNNNFNNLKINCAGDVKLVSGNFNNIKVFSGGDFQLSSATLSGTTVVYAEKTISALGSGSFSGQGIIYTNGSLNPSNLSINFEGLVACKGPLTFSSGSLTFRSNPSFINSLETDPFVTGGVTSSIKPPTNSEIFQSTTIGES